MKDVFLILKDNARKHKICNIFVEQKEIFCWGIATTRLHHEKKLETEN